ncbi:phBC6A51 family helix-turn-helix protein [Marinitoga lauensis]|uniref:phBC6A51 family helix-turn-helix protein n=1 Tax=Marinitoga lauensis TaxID=2201189 RepID=UPI001012A9E1|nr:phBC6A51 family helix-turn-helix protein [Marinitoga lauensis]
MKKKLRKTERKGLSRKQLKAIEMLIDIENNYTHKEIYTQLEISHDTFYKWLKNPLFIEELNKRSEEFFKRSLYKVNAALLKKIEKGDVSAMRLYFEKLNEFKEKIELSGSVENKIDSKLEELTVEELRAIAYGNPIKK